MNRFLSRGKATVAKKLLSLIVRSRLVNLLPLTNRKPETKKSSDHTTSTWQNSS